MFKPLWGTAAGRISFKIWQRSRLLGDTLIGFSITCCIESDLDFRCFGHRIRSSGAFVFLDRAGQSWDDSGKAGGSRGLGASFESGSRCLHCHATTGSTGGAMHVVVRRSAAEAFTELVPQLQQQIETIQVRETSQG